MANVSPEIIFEMLFLALSGVDVDFSGRELWWRTYTNEKVLPTTRRIKLVGKKEFAAAALNLEHETSIVHVASLSSNLLVTFNVHPSRRPRISGLIIEEALIEVLAEYSDFANVFSLDLASELPKHNGINDHANKLVDSYQQPLYWPIYNLGLVELEIMKAYIETNLANGFITPSKFPADAFILFEWK